MLETVIQFRPFKRSDREFVAAQWVNGLYFGSDWYQSIPRNIYFETYNRVINQIFSRPNLQILVACLKEEPDAIVGYIVFEGDACHWLYVKQTWRKNGIGKSLITKSQVYQFTHLTRVGASILKNHKELIFNPFVL